MTRAFLTTAAFLGLAVGSTQAQEVETQNVRLVFKLIEANGFEETDPAITDIVEELRQLFRFDGYRLLDTSVLRGVVSEGGSLVRQRLALGDYGTFAIEAWLSRSSSPNTIRVSVSLSDAQGEFVTGGKRVTGPEIMHVSVNVRSGQTVVLGSGRPDGTGGALILVMSAEIDPDQ